MGDAKVDKFIQQANTTIQASQNMYNAALNREAMAATSNTNIWLQPQPVQTLDLVNTGGSVFNCGGSGLSYGGNSDLAFAMGCMTDTANLVNNIRMSLANSTPTGAAGQKAGTQQQINLNNSADSFSNITPEILKDMKAKEAEIKQKEERFKELDKKESDKITEEEKQEKETLAKSLGELKASYRELDKKYGNGSPLSGMFGEEFNFYGNFDTMDLSDINNQNARIKTLKTQLEGKQKEYNDKIAELQKKAQGLAQKTGKNPALEDFCSKDEKAYVDKLEKEIQDLQKQISDNIDKNSAYIKEAGKKDDGYLSFGVFEQRKDIKDREDAKNAGNAQVVSELANALFDKDGNPVKLDDIKKAITANNSSYSKETIDAVAEFLQKQIKDNGKTKADFEKYLESDKFFEAVPKTQFNGTDGADNLRLLVETYDELKGSGAFKDAVKDGKTGSPKWGLNKAIDSLKEKEPKAPENPASAEKPKEPEKAQKPEGQKTPTAEVKTIKTKEEAQEKLIELTGRHKIEGTPKTDWDAVLNEINQDNYDADSKAKLLAVFEVAKATAEKEAKGK